MVAPHFHDLSFFFGALLWGSMIHKHTERWMWRGSTPIDKVETIKYSGVWSMKSSEGSFRNSDGLKISQMYISRKQKGPLASRYIVLVSSWALRAWGAKKTRDAASKLTTSYFKCQPWYDESDGGWDSGAGKKCRKTHLFNPVTRQKKTDVSLPANEVGGTMVWPLLQSKINYFKGTMSLKRRDEEQ